MHAIFADRSSLLMCAVSLQCIPAVSALLDILRSRVNTAGPDRQLPLVIAAAKGTVEMCRLLLEAGADVMCLDAHGRCPLWAAASREQGEEKKKVTCLLLEKLAGNLKQSNAETLEFLHRRRCGGLTLAQHVVMWSEDELLLTLAKSKLVVNLVYTGVTPLRSICEVGFIQTALLFVRCFVRKCASRLCFRKHN